MKIHEKPGISSALRTGPRISIWPESNLQRTSKTFPVIPHTEPQERPRSAARMRRGRCAVGENPQRFTLLPKWIASISAQTEEAP